MRSLWLLVISALMMSAVSSEEIDDKTKQTIITQEYILNKANGRAYKIMYKAKEWKGAKKACEEEHAMLAFPKNEDEFKYLQALVRKINYPNIQGASDDYRLLVWVGINNMQDYRVWRNIYGDDIRKSGFSKWSPENGEGTSNDPREPHCAGIDGSNPGLRDFWCTKQQPFICEKKAFLFN